MDFKELEASLTLYTFKLRKLQRLWIPLQKYASHSVLVLWLIGVGISLLSQSYFHWLITGPTICIVMALEIIIEEVQIDLLLMTEEARYLLGVTRDIHQRTTYYPGTSCHQ